MRTPLLPDPPLEGTRWRLTAIGDEPLRGLDGPREPHLVLQPDEHRATGSGGCNSFSGGYEVVGDQLRFSAIATTLMACLDGMEVEGAFLGVLDHTRRWRIDGALELLDANGGVLARLVATDSA